MSNWIKLDGTTLNYFFVGTTGAAFDSSVVTSPYVLTLPPDTGTANQVLTTDGTGVLSWTTVTPGNQPPEPDASYYTYDADENIVEITDVYGTENSITNIVYNDDGLVETVEITYLGVTRLETYTYDDEGNVLSMVATTL